MIYRSLRGVLLSLLHAPDGPPDPPSGSSESVRVFRAAPNYLRLRLGVFLAGHALGLFLEGSALVGLVAGEEAEAGAGGLALMILFVGLTLVSLVVSWLLIRLEYDMRYYVVTDRSLRIREGAMTIREATFTYANIQNLMVHQGPLERFLGISNLVVQTAGGSGSNVRTAEGKAQPVHQGVFRGIANATEVRDTIQRLMRRYRDAGLGDPEERGAPGPGLSTAALDRLVEIRDELAGWRASLEGRP